MPQSSGVHGVIGEASTEDAPRLLVVEDNRGDAELIELHLEESPLKASLTRVPRLADAKRLLAEDSFDCVLLDLGLPDSRGVDTLRSLRETAPEVPVVVLTGLGEVADATACVRRGAQEYLEKAQLGPRSLTRAIELAILRVREATVLRELRQADRLRSVGLLAAGVAHEVNNPLTVLGMTLRELADTLRPALPEALRAVLDEGVRQCESDVERISAIVSRLGSFSRADEHRPATPVSLDAVARDALRLTKHRWSGHFEIEQSLSPTPPVLGYPSELTQVVVNLLMNATQALQNGGGRRIEVRTRVTGAMVELSVSDDGPGIAPSVLERIFDPFYTTKSRARGTGLGLAICRGIVKSHGGTLRARSRSGVGTTFTIRLPPSLEQPPVPATPKSVAEHGEDARRRVLFVDDEPALLRSVRRLLTGKHDVVTTGSGEQAIALFEAGERFDVVFCDLTMPGMGGGEVYQWLVEHRPAMADRFVLTSGGAPSDVLATLPDILRLAKPFKPARILSMIDALTPEAVDDKSSAE